jgi:LPS-assembly protein
MRPAWNIAAWNIAAWNAWRLAAGLPLALALLAAGSGVAMAQQQRPLAGVSHQSLDQNQPVTFLADRVEYDQQHALVIATGHVEAWQNGHVLRADRIVFDRNTDVAAAYGNVQLLEPDGEVMFSDYAELAGGMRDGVLRGMSAILAENGRLVANGARRIDGKINELSKLVYSTCNLCADDPTSPPLWQLRALSAVQDVENKRIEYQDAVMEIYGIPVAYFPYFWHPDPSVKRQSGMLIPSIGNSSHLGAFVAVPYYWVIDGQSDVTVTPMITSKAGPQVDVDYRYRFNTGSILFNGSLGELGGKPEGTVDLKGRFDYDDTWRYGFDINRASSADYVRDFQLGHYLDNPSTILTSQAFIEGFGEGSYTRLETKFYQSITDATTDTQLPVVAPRYVFSYFGRPDSLGGRLSLDAGAFNVMRNDGTNTRRANLTANWERPFTGPLGDLWKITLHGDSAAYDASHMYAQPNFSPRSTIDTARALPQMSVDTRWPLMRDSGAWGSQLIEPITQLIVAPRVGNSQLTQIPNEDSLDFEFTDANLFGFNRFSGIDRLEGGARANVALHGAWYLNGTTFDALIGQAYQAARDDSMPVGSGLRDTVSDVVAHASFAPTKWLDLTYRTRLDKNSGATRLADVTASAGVDRLRLTAGYIYTTDNPYNMFAQAPPLPATSSYYVPRNEITLGASSKYDRYSVGGYVRQDLQTGQLVTVGANAAYEDECFILQMLFYRRYTSFNGDSGSSTVLFQVTFKSIGQFGFHAM